MCQATDKGQDEIIQFLSDSQAYGVSNANADDLPDTYSNEVDRIDTHSAHLFLHRNDVYKVKRAVKYSYVDMTSLDTRFRFCHRELELNSSVLPDVYLGVVAVTCEEDGSLQLGGAGQPVEWALHMSRFDEDLVMDNIAKQGHLTPQLAAETGRSIARYHAGLVSEPVTDGCKRIEEVVFELIHELGEHVALFSQPRISEFQVRGLRELEDCRSSLDRRAVDGFVKRCHGDLHLRNLVLIDGVPKPFDALEFDERMATTDVLYDLAFLIMDMHYRGLALQANQVLNQYLLHCSVQAVSGLHSMPLFLFCRAGIRAMTSAQAAQFSVEDSAKLSQQAKAYLTLALGYLDSRTPALVAIGGLSGCGKSTVAARLAPALGVAPGALLIRSDAERKVTLGMEETAELPPDHYTPETARLNYEHMIEKAGIALDTGQSVIVDAVFLDTGQRSRIERCARDRGIPFIGIWLEAPPDVLMRRIAARTGDASDATVEVLQKQLATKLGSIGWNRLDVSKTPDQVLIDTKSLIGSLNAALLCGDAA